MKKDMQEYLVAKQTVENILGMDRKREEERKEKQQEAEERESRRSATVYPPIRA